jgi:predicted nucleic acid-binding protein
LRAPEAPAEVRRWITNHPRWLAVSSEPLPDEGGLEHLHAGERDAISLALRVRAEALVIDERRGREEAERRGLNVIGTVGALAAAHEAGLLDLTDAFERLRQTTFHVSTKLLAAILRKYEG